MKFNIILINIFLCVSILEGYSQNAITSLIYPNYHCNVYNVNGISTLIQNKSWKMSKMYGNQVPFSDSIAKSFMFLFKADSLHTSDTLFIIRKVENEFSGLSFKYVINQSNSTISLYQFETNIFQKQFKITCLTPGHLAFEFDEIDKSDITKTVRMEYRFLVDYTMTPP